MSENPPVVYILNGDDEFAIAGFLRQLVAAVGDAAMAELNTTRLDGRTIALDELVRAASAMPFLTARRLVIVSHPLAKLKSAAERQKLTAYLEKVPPTTALALAEFDLLTGERERKSGKTHWLEAWAQKAGDRVYFRTFALPHGAAMARWIVERAKAAGGQFTQGAAERLSELIGDEPRLADQEIQKLLMYVNFSRPVEPEDVEHLTPDSRQGDIFAMVDALGQRNGRSAQAMYHRLLSEQDALSIFGMVIRQFRLLLQAREVMDGGGQPAEISREVKIHPFVAGKLAAQARLFSLPALEAIYRRLLELDEAAKTSQMDGDLGLDTLIAELAG